MWKICANPMLGGVPFGKDEWFDNCVLSGVASIYVCVCVCPRGHEFLHGNYIVY